MADAIVEFDGFETMASEASADHQFSIDMVQCERWDDAGNSCDVVFIDRDGQAHGMLNSGDLEFLSEYVVEIVDLHQEWVEYEFEEEDDDLMIKVQGAFCLEGTAHDLDSLVDCDMQIELVAREDGDSPILPCTFEVECSATLKSVDHEWTA